VKPVAGTVDDPEIGALIAAVALFRMRR
jgi:hypothetical protein